MADESLGLMSICRICGGANKRTGRIRLDPPRSGLGLSDAERVRSEEYSCTQCGSRVWGATGTKKPPPKGGRI